MGEKKEGLVIKVMGLYYTVLLKDGPINCFLRGKIRLDKKWLDFSNPVAVGDRVIVDIEKCGTGIIREVHERKNVFSRKLKGRKIKQDIIAANADRLLIVQSIFDPMINLRFVDRLYVHAVKENIKPTLCVNKIDLCDEEAISCVNEYYNKTDLEIFYVSAEQGTGIDKMMESLSGQTTVLAGFSGVGKTSILRRVFPDYDLKISEISQSTGKGRHTTTNVIRYELDNETSFIDTPGLREFGIMDIEPHLLSRYFYEFKKYTKKCNYPSCTHDHEPGCHVKFLVEKKKISEERYVSYLNILNSIRDHYDNLYA